MQEWFHFLAAGGAADGLSPQILTDALDGSDPSPSAGAGETGSKTEKTEICVYHCQNRYSACHPHEGKLCQVMTYSESQGIIHRCLEKGENCVLREKQSI